MFRDSMKSRSTRASFSSPSVQRWSPARLLEPCQRFVQRRVGLHHVCFRARDRADVEEAYAFVQELGATIVHGPQEDHWAPGYYSILFEDPDGVRLEINHVPGRGVFDAGGKVKLGPEGE